MTQLQPRDNECLLRARGRIRAAERGGKRWLQLDRELAIATVARTLSLQVDVQCQR